MNSRFKIWRKFKGEKSRRYRRTRLASLASARRLSAEGGEAIVAEYRTDRGVSAWRIIARFVDGVDRTTDGRLEYAGTICPN